jgi:hypothetical protein
MHAVAQRTRWGKLGEGLGLGAGGAPRNYLCNSYKIESKLQASGCCIPTSNETISAPQGSAARGRGEKVHPHIQRNHPCNGTTPPGPRRPAPPPLQR